MTLLKHIDEKRLDVIIKYLYVKAYIEQKNYNYYKKLYLDSIKLINGGIEDNKTSTQTFLTNFNKLINSLQQKGYNKKYPIPLDKNNIILNGAHRLSACTYLNIPIITTKQHNTTSSCNYDLNFFKKGGFKEKDLTKIINIFCQLKKQTNTIILWEPSKKHWNQIENEISTKYKILFTYTLKLKKKAMKNLIKDLYSFEFQLENNNYIDLKIKKLEQLSTNSKIKIIITESKKRNFFKRGNQKIDKELFELKETIRKQLNQTIPKEDFITLHTNDNSEHSLFLINNLFNKNNLNYLNYKSNRFQKRTEKKLKQLDKFLTNNNLSKSQICITSGSVLEICGIRKSSDIDIICQTNINIKYPNKLIDIHPESFKNYKKELTNNQIINTPDHHFFHKGYKFVNLEIVKLNRTTTHNNRKFDIKLIDNFFKKKKYNKPKHLEKINLEIRLLIYQIYRKTNALLIRKLSNNQKKIIKKILNTFFGKNYKL